MPHSEGHDLSAMVNYFFFVCFNLERKRKTTKMPKKRKVSLNGQQKMVNNLSVDRVEKNGKFKHGKLNSSLPRKKITREDYKQKMLSTTCSGWTVEREWTRNVQCELNWTELQGVNESSSSGVEHHHRRHRTGKEKRRGERECLNEKVHVCCCCWSVK